MTLADWLAVVVFLPILLLALSQLPKLWRHETDFWDGKAPGWWVWGETLFRGWVRSLIALTLTGTLLLGVFVLGVIADIGEESQTSSDAVQLAFAVSFVLLVLLFIAGITVSLFNRPKFIVPPHLRGERGAIEQWARARSRSRRK
jgi:hypothetical protein